MTRCAAADLGAVVVAALDGARSVVVPPGWTSTCRVAVVDDGLTSAELDAVDAVVTGAAVGIAETGTVVLDHGPGQGRRVITLLPDLHVCVVRESQVVPDVADALARLDPMRPQTWVSGPSATSDIELTPGRGRARAAPPARRPRRRLTRPDSHANLGSADAGDRPSSTSPR